MPIIDYGAKALKLENALFESKNISKRNKELLQRFLVSYDVSPARLSIFIERIRILLEMDDDVEAVLKDRDRINLLFRELRNKYAPATCNTFANVAIRFGRWLFEGELPVGLKDVAKLRSSKEKRDLDPSDMISWEDGLMLGGKTISVQVKAIVLTQLDAGFRPSEFVDLNYGDVSVLDRVVVFHVRGGKTGSRDVVAYRSAPHFLKWYNSHPTKKPEDPLWVREYFHPSRTNEYIVERYAYPAIRKRVRSLGFRCDFKKPLDFYNLRHSSCALDKIDNLPVELAADRHGHSVKYFTNVYGRLSTTDVINRFKLHYGEKISEKTLNRNILCEHCEYPNPHEGKMCLRCNASLNSRDAIAGATGKFKEILEKETEIGQRSKDLKDQQNRMIELDTRIKMMDESLSTRNAEIDAKMESMQKQAKEVALREIRIKLANEA
jgi:integrase